MVTRTAFGALPIQRVTFEEAGLLLRKACEAGVNFFDTARSYSDSEEKIGYSLADVRDKIIIATKSHAATTDELKAHVETSLRNMKTDRIDILQMHNPKELPDPDDAGGVYAAMAELKKAGTIGHIGMSNHRLDVALAAARSGLFETIQFPLSVISADKDLELISVCRENGVGVIAMKAMAGGLIRNTRAAFAFFRQFDNVAAIWGVQRESELDEFLAYEAEGIEFDEAMKAAAKKERDELGDDFCRGCGYCLPCSVHIPINNAARMSLLIRRAPQEAFLSERWQKEMMKIEDCIECGLCRDRCPYGLDTPALLKKNLEDYRTFLK